MSNRSRPEMDAFTVDEALDSLESSNGFLVMCFRGIGVSTFYVFNPGRNGYEQIETRNAPRRREGRIDIDTENVNHGVYDRKTIRQSWDSWIDSKLETMTIEFMTYPESPFPHLETTPEEWMQ